jgi:hypothetical protein
MPAKPSYPETTLPRGWPSCWAEVVHRYAKPGHYLVCVKRRNRHGQTGYARLDVRVGEWNTGFGRRC